MARLTEAEFMATMADPMGPVRDAHELPAGFWEYVDDIGDSDLDGRSVGPEIAHSYADPTDQWHHLLIATDEDQVFLVVILDSVNNAIRGHHVLDLPRLYGLREPT